MACRREEGGSGKAKGSRGPGGRGPAAYPGLPAGYDLYETLDMASDRAVFKRISWCSLIIAVVMIVLGHLAVSPGLMLDGGGLHVLLAAGLTVGPWRINQGIHRRGGAVWIQCRLGDGLCQKQLVFLTPCVYCSCTCSCSCMGSGAGSSHGRCACGVLLVPLCNSDIQHQRCRR